MASFTILDPVHGKAIYPAYIEKLILTEEFSRLRNLKQIGVSYQVFNSANHTRFEHCLGVCFLSLKLMDCLQHNSGVKIEEIHKKCVAIAALFHDIGHGPFSHMWESFVALRNPTLEWTHEQTSADIVQHFFRKYDDFKLSDNPLKHLYAVELIQAFIVGDLEAQKNYLSPEMMFLGEIVNNKFTQIDVDKWDYILRDAYYLNNNINLKDFTTMFDHVRVTKDDDGVTHISFSVGDFQLIHNLFDNRANLHIYCYQCPEVRAAEQMLLDALVAAEESGFQLRGLPLSQIQQDITKFNYLDDTVISLIKCSDDPNLVAAQDILRRFIIGDIYRLVWMSPTRFNIEPLVEKFGPHFFQVHKRVPLACAFVTRAMILHNEDGERVPVPPEILTRRGAYYEEFLIFTKLTTLDHLTAVKDFIHDMKD